VRSQTVSTDNPWISPSSGARLLACPFALVNPPCGETPPTLPVSTPNNVGTLAHLALQRWVETEAWRSPEAGIGLARQFTEIADSAGIDYLSLYDGRQTEARLRLRGESLAQTLKELAGPHGAVRSELALISAQLRLWGTLDIVVEAQDEVHVIDLKTGADSSPKVINTDIRRQLLLYAALVRSELEVLPGLHMFSLRRGLRRLEFSAEEVDRAIAEIARAVTAWTKGERTANPDPDTCKWCRRRADCEAHWEAAASWDHSDGIQGQLLRIDRSENGRSALRLRDGDSGAWVYDLDQELAHLMIGANTRVLRVRLISAAISPDGSTQWRAGPATQVSQPNLAQQS
jgi:hypothetical protein